jgi:hypothetical protein
MAPQVDPEAVEPMLEMGYDGEPHASIEPVAVTQDERRPGASEVVDGDRFSIGARHDMG